MGKKGIQLKDSSGNEIYPNPFPVGAIYMSVDSRNPSKIFGGTWEQIQDKFLLCAGSTYKAGTTGGEANHTLTINEMPSHGHNYSSGRWYWAEQSGGGEIINSQSETSYMFSRGTGNTGGGQAHNNMPPYLAVYVWRRTK